MIIELTLLNPNSLNNHWSKSKSGVFLSAKGREFRKHVIEVVEQAGYKDLKLTGRLKYTAIYCRNDKRRVDLDNFCTKAVFDAFTHSGLWVDDTQIDYVQYQRGENTTDKISRLYVKIEEI